MGTKTTQSEAKTVTKSKIKVMNFEKEFFPNMVHTNAKASNKEEARKTTDGVKRALQEFLMA